MNKYSVTRDTAVGDNQLPAAFVFYGAESGAKRPSILRDKPIEPLFSIGRLVATPAVLNWPIELMPYLHRHMTGDWGDVGNDDKIANDSALTEYEGRLFSAYDTPCGRLWIITEWDRTVTTILRPEDY